MIRTYRTALLCWLLPLLAGISIFWLWLLTLWDWLPTAGMFLMIGGTVLWGFGMSSLVRLGDASGVKKSLSVRQRRWGTTVCAFLLTSNFAVAIWIISVVIQSDDL
jgi:hypothetical protein